MDVCRRSQHDDYYYAAFSADVENVSSGRGRYRRDANESNHRLSGLSLNLWPDRAAHIYRTDQHEQGKDVA